MKTVQVELLGKIKYINLIKVFLILFISFTFFTDITNAGATTDTLNEYNLTTGSEKVPLKQVSNYLEGLKNAKTDFVVAKGGKEGIYNMIIRLSRDIKNLFFLVAGVYLIILVLMLLFSDKSDEASSNFKKGIIWTSIGIFITQISYYFVNVLFGKEINNALAVNFVDVILRPLIELAQTSAGFVFIAIMIYSFYAIITAGGDEEKVKSGKMAILYAAIGFIVVKISNTLVGTMYGKTRCSTVYQTNCLNDVNIEGVAGIIVTIIDWMNGFIGLIVILIIIYAGFQVLTSAGDEEKLKKAKTSIIYIAIGLLILFINYFILTFFILPEAGI